MATLKLQLPAPVSGRLPVLDESLPSRSSLVIGMLIGLVVTLLLSVELRRILSRLLSK